MVVILTVATMSLTPLLNQEEVVSWLMRRQPRSRRRLLATQGHSPVPPLIPVFDRTQAAFVRAQGGQPIDIARSTEENLIKWCRNLPTASGSGRLRGWSRAAG